jgi:hypothetical protein
LTAHTLRHALQQQRRRPIARFVFFGSYHDGSAVDFGADAAEAAKQDHGQGEKQRLGSETHACRLGVGLSESNSLPAGLRAAVEGIARERERKRGKIEEREWRMLLDEVLIDYVAGSDEIVQGLHSGLVVE